MVRMACTHYQNPLCYKQLLLCTVNETIVLTAHFDVTSNLYLFFSLTGSDGQLCYRVLKSLFKSESCLFLTSPEIFQENMALVERMEALKQELETEKLKCSMQ